MCFMSIALIIYLQIIDIIELQSHDQNLSKNKKVRKKKMKNDEVK